MKKKILSLVLAICMIISLVPVISASAESGQAYQLVYDFRNIDGVSGGVIADLNGITYAKTEGTWAFDSSSGDNVEHKVNYGIEIKSDSVGDYFAVKINVPYEGNYSAILDYYQYGSGDTTADVYLVSENTADITSPTELEKTGDIGKAVPFDKEGGANDVISADAVEMNLPAGEHILVFKVTKADGSSSSQKRIRPSKLTLTSGTPAEGDSYAKVPMYMEASVEEAELKVGESATLTVSGWMNDGTPLSTSATVSFKSKAGYVSIKNGVVTAMETGTDVITATVESGEKSLSKDISVTVIPDVPSPAYQLVYDFSNLDESGYTSDAKTTLIYDKVVFAATDGTWAFHSRNDLLEDTVTYKTYGIEIKSDSVGDYFAVKINVPYGGDYIPSLTYYEQNTKDDTKYVAADVYVLPEGSNVSTATESDKKFIAQNLYFNRNGGKDSATDLAKHEKDTSIKLTAGENILVFEVTDGPGGHSISRMRPGVLTLTSGTIAEGDSYATVPMYISEAKVNDAELETGDTTALEVSGWFNDGTTFDETSVSFSTESGNISMDGNTVTANSAGTATVTATVTSGKKSLSEDIAITVISADVKQITDAFTVASAETGYNVTASAVVYVEDENNHGIVASATPVGDIYEMKAPTKDGYTFLYWAKALETNKKIVSLAAEFNYKPAANESNILIAVYKKTSASETSDTAEFYNANGQLLYTTAEDSIDENNVTVEDGILTIPALPTMAGYSTATHWQLYGDEEAVQYGADVNTVELSGTMIFVASYPEAPTKMVEVNGKSVAYGTPVTFTADTSKGALKWWIKKVNGVDEIVSIEDTYSFLAWENCTVTGVYGEAKPVYTGQKMKIIIDTFGIDGIMAEFIGFENASVVEKGIMYNNKKISMTTDKPQFTVSGDTGTFKGYAIIKVAENQFKEIIDGEVIK